MSSAFTAPLHALTYLHDRGIAEAAAQEARLRHLPADAIKKGMWGTNEDDKHSVPGDGLEIPYFDLADQPIIGLDGLPFRRYRIFDTRTEKQLGDKKPTRYMSAPGSGYRAYMPAGLNRLVTNCPPVLVITEGEIKALSAVHNGLACIGIGGVTLWMHPESHRNGDEITVETVIHPEIVDLVQKIGRVVVLADSDAKTNTTVRESMQLFAAALRHQVSSAVVAYARCDDPVKKDKDGKEVVDKKGKQGLDDWITKDGATSVERKLIRYLRIEEVRVSTSREAGYKALGFDDRAYYVWSNAKGTIEALGKDKLTNPSLLMSICRHDWCKSEYPKFTKTGVSVDWMELGGDLAAACEANGPFDPDQLRGPGVWTHANDQNVLVINSAKVWRSDAVHIDRVTPEFVYPRYRDLGVAFDTVAATEADAGAVLAALQSWQWVRQSDALLLLGWIGLGYVAGALKWRPHLSLTGQRGTGKSTLMGLMRDLLGKAAIFSEGNSSEAGIRQSVRSSAPALLLDEGEADGPHLARVLEFLRVASSGGTVLKGTADQQGRSYALRALGCIAGINPPAMQPADASRFLRLSLASAPDAASAKPQLLNDCSGDASELGKRLFARVIALWPRYLRAQRSMRAYMPIGSARSVDTLSPAVAMAYCMLKDAELTDEAAKTFVDGIDLTDDFDRIASASDSDDFWSLLMTRAVHTTAAGMGQKTVISEIIENAARDKCKGAWSRELGVYGMKLVHHSTGKFELRVNTKASEFAGLLKGTKFEHADLAEALKRHPNAERKCLKTDRIGGGNPVRYVSLALEISIPTVAGPVSPSALD